MARRGHAELFQVLVGQVSQDGKIDVVISKMLSVLPKTELPKPIRNLLQRGSASGGLRVRDNFQRYLRRIGIQLLRWQ
jgi:hypothetical protein